MSSDTTNRSADISPMAYARLAGLLYLVIIICGIFSEGFVRASLVVSGDATATAQNILAAQTLFRIGFASDTLVFLSDVAIAVLFYALLRPVSQTLATMAMAFRLTQTAIIGLNLLDHYTALTILGGADRFGAFDVDQRNALALLYMDAHSHGYDLGLLFFGVGSLILGYLVYRASYFPRALGILVMAAGLVYVMGGYLRFLAPDYAEAFQPIYIVPLVAELSFCLWLLIKGMNVAKWEQQTTAPFRL